MAETCRLLGTAPSIPGDTESHGRIAYVRGPHMKRIALLAAAVALTLAGCSQPINTGSPPPAASSAAQPETTPTPEIDCATASQADWQEYCSEVPPEDNEGQVEPVPAGKPFEYVKTYSDDSEPAFWEVTLDKVNCGGKSIPEADSNPDWDGGNENPEYIAAKPDDGNEFCVVYWSWKNVGTEPATTDRAGNIVLGEERFAASSEDEMRSWTVMETELGVNYSKQINPRGKAKSLDIYQIPAGEKPTGIWFPMDTMVSESYILVSAP